VRLIGIEAAGRGLDTTEHAASLNLGKVGVLHGSRSYVLQDDEGQTLPVHSISAGLDYPGVGPEHSHWKETGRVTYVSATDQQAVDAFQRLCRLEGIIPALESSHAVAHAMEIAPKMAADQVIVICLSGRGDKDCFEVARCLGEEAE
jgi:tryptophan synthase beta chain